MPSQKYLKYSTWSGGHWSLGGLRAWGVSSFPVRSAAGLCLECLSPANSGRLQLSRHVSLCSRGAISMWKNDDGLPPQLV